MMYTHTQSAASDKQDEQAEQDEQRAHMKAHTKRLAYVNKLCTSPFEHDRRMYRLYHAAGCFSPRELADFLKTSTGAIAKARKSGIIPDAWLLLILRACNVHPDWIVLAKGPMHVERTPEGEYESFQSISERREDITVLNSISSFALTQELLRRLALANG